MDFRNKLLHKRMFTVKTTRFNEKNKQTTKILKKFQKLINYNKKQNSNKYN
jgi:hypothetical protein